MSGIVYSRLPRPTKITPENLVLKLDPNFGPALTGQTSLGLPHYDIITIDGISYPAYSCGCPRLPNSDHDPFPKRSPSGTPLCPYYQQFRNSTYYPDITENNTTTLQCGCKYNYWVEDFRGSYEGNCHSPEKCLHNKAYPPPSPTPTPTLEQLQFKISQLEEKINQTLHRLDNILQKISEKGI